ncbi:hypothetical protein QWJ34_23630 [Saccharibacillus sp. CPCC 101409]|uniref:hypothetical protein n=1 Tax=Saccharibacillus sp. CPCC 101409 TaxID=3058041 RepID=UPI002673BD50|nr:hypothetical protein [Saccharibacillus sp. CPCC 101409]MDO3412779.1 hypothetical protein [Saccharibacillus sp. CPCC 101409]
MATAASAAETTPSTGTTTTTDTTTTAPATTTTTTPTSNATANFVGNQNGYTFPTPAYWDSRVTNTELNADQLKALNESGVYRADFTYTPEFAAPNGSLDPVKFASIRGYERTVWDSITNKDTLGTVLNQTGDIVYVLEPVTANPFTNAADMERFSNLLQGVRSGVSTNFSTTVNPTLPTNPSTTVPVGTDTPVVGVDTGKVVANPTPVILITGTTPFYDAPNGKTLGYLQSQKVDTTGNGSMAPAAGQWVEIYTWIGKGWILVK